MDVTGMHAQAPAGALLAWEILAEVDEQDVFVGSIFESDLVDFDSVTFTVGGQQFVLDLTDPVPTAEPEPIDPPS